VAYSYKNSKGQEYFLHSKEVEFRGGRKFTIYYFAREVKKTGAIDTIPEGMVVTENTRTGLPLLKKDGKAKK
jgi:hypothetical protein